EMYPTTVNKYNTLDYHLILTKRYNTKYKGDLINGSRYSNEDIDESVYLELKPFEKIRFTWENPKHAPGTEVMIEIISLTYDVTRVRINHLKLESEEQIESMRESWTWTLDNLKIGRASCRER